MVKLINFMVYHVEINNLFKVENIVNHGPV